MTPLARLTTPLARLAGPLSRIKWNRTWLGYAGYSAFFLACFVVFAATGFPYERLTRYLEQEVAHAWKPAAPGAAPTRLSIGDMGATWNLGIALDDVKVEQDPSQPGRMPVALAFDRLALRPSYLGLLFGTRRASFDVTIGDGSIDGTVSASGADWAVDAELDEVDLGVLGLGGMLGIPVGGIAAGQLTLTGGEEPTATSGTIELAVENLVLADGKAKVPVPGMGQGLTVEPIKAGKLDVKIAVREGVAAFEKFEARGNDIELDASGSIRLGKPFERSRVDITLEWKFADGYKQRNDRTRAVFQLMDANPLLKRAQSGDGTMRFTLSGSPSSLHSRPAGATGGAGTAGGMGAGARPARRSFKTKAPE